MRSPDPSPSVAPSLGTAVMGRLDIVAGLTDEPGALTRLFLSPAHKAAARQVGAWMEAAGMRVALDAAGTMVGRYEGDRPGAPALLLGSHIDTVRNAGRYDGNLGVVTAIAAVSELHARGIRRPFAVEVLAFGDEEGVRFPVTLTGSRALAGGFDPKALECRDGDGISLRQALRDFGLTPEGLPLLARSPADVLGYLEVHIEQGPVLEAEDLPVGIVTAIAGAARYGVVVEGAAGHAGTVPMGLRRDAAAATAEMILAVEAVALAEAGLVATVGTVEVPRGAVNVIAAETRFTIDIRSPDDTIRGRALAEIVTRFDAIAARRGVSYAKSSFYETPAVACAPGLVAAIEAGIRRLGIRPRRLPSGAGHDGLALAALCPIGMIFVRCAGGISHSPRESITAEDADAAARLLVDILSHFDPATR
ncbi:allantoate amidohydrolase [Methylobacterium planeticum]|uniref:Allantoate amidohydrolase n=1 Tax=Methylobacterium planeticum TaxID=2615211 RepID=A0A6N6MM58_9HYPH|nr:allantoate amidohydrolase [Methylobacterium planeticum]KAB1072402.1 allantoate amidohydrolase [Methylobacterium planeticum]